MMPGQMSLMRAQALRQPAPAPAPQPMPGMGMQTLPSFPRPAPVAPQMPKPMPQGPMAQPGGY